MHGDPTNCTQPPPKGGDEEEVLPLSASTVALGMGRNEKEAFTTSGTESTWAFPQARHSRGEAG